MTGEQPGGDYYLMLITWRYGWELRLSLFGRTWSIGQGRVRSGPDAE